MSLHPKPGDNGELNLKKEVEKTAEALLEEKKKAFEKEPERFIDLNDVVFAMIRIPGGLANFMGSARRREYNITKSECQYQIDKVLAAIDIKMAKKSKSSIFNPFANKGGGAFGGKRF